MGAVGQHWLAVVGRSAVLGDVAAGRVRRVDDVGVGQHVELVALGVQLHGVRHLVPAEAEEALVVSHHVTPHHHVRLEVRLPLDLDPPQQTKKHHER